MAEQGVPGALIILALLWWTTVIGFRVYRALRHEDTWNSWWALSVYLGVLTYFIHGVLNNYLDTDKASAPFWGFLAMLVMLDLKKNGWSAGRYRQRGLPSDDAAPNPR